MDVAEEDMEVVGGREEEAEDGATWRQERPKNDNEESSEIILIQKSAGLNNLCRIKLLFSLTKS